MPQSRSQGEVGPGKSKASLLRMLRNEPAKSRLPNGNVFVTVLLVKSRHTVWLVLESLPRVRTNKKAFEEVTLKFWPTQHHRCFNKCHGVQKYLEHTCFTSRSWC